MRFGSNVVTVLSAFVFVGLVACGGSKNEAKGPEANPWADYKGTYATVGTPHEAKAKPEKTDKNADKADKAEANAKEAKPEAKADEPAAAPKKPSKGTIKGESVSSIGLDAFTDASKGALKSKVVSTKYVVGPQYEEMQVQLKGATVQVIRPAANPAADGPAVASPKERSGGVSKTESSWYDADADVVVVVTSKQKPVSAKALGSILKK
jgi:hypothetical protein